MKKHLTGPLLRSIPMPVKQKPLMTGLDDKDKNWQDINQNYAKGFKALQIVALYFETMSCSTLDRALLRTPVSIIPVLVALVADVMLHSLVDTRLADMATNIGRPVFHIPDYATLVRTV